MRACSARPQTRSTAIRYRTFRLFRNKKDLAAIDRDMAPDFYDHDGPGGKPTDRDGDRTTMATSKRLLDHEFSADFNELLYRRSTGAIALTKADLSDVYRDYIACLNKQDWPKLGQFVHEEVIHNGKCIGILGYREMLEKDFYEIPDLHFDIQLLICDPPYIAIRLKFDCTPKGQFLGLDVNGTTVSFSENVIYEFRSEKIVRVWSVVDKAAIEIQL